MHRRGAAGDEAALEVSGTEVEAASVCTISKRSAKRQHPADASIIGLVLPPSGNMWFRRVPWVILGSTYVPKGELEMDNFLTF